MTSRVSVVIICKNEAYIISRTIAVALLLTDDVVVVDSGSTDGTQLLVTNAGVRLLETSWEGYGKNKNKGAAIAKYPWILSIDADEIANETLVKEIQNISLEDPDTVYNISRRAFFGNKMIRYGEWANDARIRLYNREHSFWNEAEVHEALVLPGNTQIVNLKGYLHHYTTRNLHDFALKIVNYAALSAAQNFKQGKKAGWLKPHISAFFSFIKNYIFRLGFLDGEPGFIIAKMSAFYTWLKYMRLRELNRSQNNR